MSRRARIDVEVANLRRLDDCPGDLLILTVFADERPLPGLAGLADWRLCGALSRWFLEGFVTGEAGERVLYPTRGRLSHPKLFLLGLGPRAQHRTDRACLLAREGMAAAIALGAARITCGLFGMERLPTPLERSVPELLATLTADPALELLTLTVEAPLVDRVKEITGMARQA
ncbi:MAG: hypothetical protein H6744_03750 [Deltaproteobacteria bacterium]|nr:hypothetical protein [Deltaproteobacteria bacterium]MCB9785791.1 hypothetical protein [Deltaproteobacteria bacterium]